MACPFDLAIKNCHACLLHTQGNPKPASMFLCEAHALEQGLKGFMNTFHTMSDEQFTSHVKTYDILINNYWNKQENKKEKNYE